MGTGFAFRDGERLIRYGAGVAAQSRDLLARGGFSGYALLTTARGEGQAPGVAEAAERVLHVPPGPVPEAAASVRADAGGLALVALGGGRVVDAAKAIGAADGRPVAAIPTTLAGSAFTPFHRPVAGSEAHATVRPGLVIADPGLMASMHESELAATAMNALAHASESLYAPGANPVAEGAALRAAALFARGLGPGALDREALALGALLGGYAIGTTGFALHHALCQTIVRVAGTPHAQTNAVMLPHTLRFMAGRAPGPLASLADALGREGEGPEAAAEAVASLAARAGTTTLRDLGVQARALPGLAAGALAHPVIAARTDGVGEEALRGLLAEAL